MYCSFKWASLGVELLALLKGTLAKISFGQVKNLVIVFLYNYFICLKVVVRKSTLVNMHQGIRTILKNSIPFSLYQIFCCLLLCKWLGSRHRFHETSEQG